MDLGLAGALSGAGEAGTKALGLAQVQYGASKLQEERDKMENLRLDKQLAAAERGRGQEIAARADEGAKSREHAETMQAGSQIHAEEMQEKGFKHTEAQTDKTMTHAETMQEKGFKHTEAQTDKQIKSHELISKEGNISHENIAKMNNKIHLQIAQIQKEMHEKQSDKTFTAARLGALKDTVRELGNEITRLSVAASNPLADKTDPSYKALMLQLEHATKLHNLYSVQVGIEAGITPEAITGATTKKEPAPWKSPTAAPAPAPRRSGGMVQVPEPPLGVTQEMVDTVQRLKDMQK